MTGRSRPVPQPAGAGLLGCAAGLYKQTVRMI